MNPTAATPHIRPIHEGRDSNSATPETMTREAHRLMESCGVHRSPSWVCRVVRDYIRSPVTGYPFGAYLLHRVQLNTEQRRAVLARADAYLLEYPDPTGETAVRNVLGRRAG